MLLARTQSYLSTECESASQPVSIICVGGSGSASKRRRIRASGSIAVQSKIQGNRLAPSCPAPAPTSSNRPLRSGSACNSRPTLTTKSEPSIPRAYKSSGSRFRDTPVTAAIKIVDNVITLQSSKSRCHSRGQADAATRSPFIRCVGP
jgi:hypothetical protein